MIPRLHRRGNSFKGALGYVLHDPGKSSSERVAWVLTQNIYSEPENAWFEMFDTYRNRTALKRNAGFAPTGRDNKTPVLHYTLAWHESDQPEPEHMKAMALDSLKMLGLGEHEAVIACHSDKEHHHVHVVANTVHPYTGKTAPLKFTKLDFSKWAEAYEKEHGIHCEQRIENNERRRELAEARRQEREATELAASIGVSAPEPRPYEPVNDNSPNRRRWFERKEIIDRMKALRAELDAGHKADRGATWAGQLAERDQVDRDTRKAFDMVRKGIKAEFKPRWRKLYGDQKWEAHAIRDTATHPLERAVYVFKNRERLGEAGKPLSLRRMIPLILSGRKLYARVLQMHDWERRALAREEKTTTKVHADRIWQSHRETMHHVRDRQAAERAAERAHQKLEQKDITFARAKAALTFEADQLAAKQGPVRAPPERQAVQAKAKSAREIASPPELFQQFGRTPAQDIPFVPRTPEGRMIDPRDLLTPQSKSAVRGTPVLPTPQIHKESGEQAKTQLFRDDKTLAGIPAVPRTPEPRREPAAKSFREAVRPATPDVQKAFRDAAAPEQPKNPAKDSPDRVRRMRDEFEKYRRRGRDDFGRER
jgi:hypothetical protein